MDPARVVASLLRPLRSPDGRGIVIGPDQALGAAASLGLSLAIYRAVSSLLRSDGSDGDGRNEGHGKRTGLLSLPAFLLTLIRAALFRKVQDGDAYHRAAYGGSKKKKNGSEGLGPDMQHRGSCHCGSIRFTLCAPRNILALDCGGKIRYPHYPTTADKFQLTKGSRHLKMYYVTVNNVSEDGTATGTTCMAAHTFCVRCGCNLLRAPDSKMDALEVNVGCLDKDGYTTVEVDYYRSDDKMGLSAGAPLPHQWLVDECDEPRPAVYADGDEDCTTLDGTHVPIHVDDISTFWPAEMELEEAGGPAIEAVGRDLISPTSASTYSMSNNHSRGRKSHGDRHPMLKAGGSEDTPSTSASTMSDVMPLPSRVVVSHLQNYDGLDCQSSIGSTDELTVSVGGSLGVIGEGTTVIMDDGGTETRGRSSSFGGWAVGSSIRPSPRESPMMAPRSLNRDQMSYYMKRHMSSSSPMSSFNSDRTISGRDSKMTQN